METYPASSSASGASSRSSAGKPDFGGVPLRILRATVPPDEPVPVARDASTFYEPPYDSDLIDAFVWNLVKYLAPLMDLRVVRFRAGDAAVILDVPPDRDTVRNDHARRRIAFLIDALPAPELGDTPAPADSATSSSAVDNVPDPLRRYVNVLYVLRPADIMHRLPDVLYLAAQWDRALFSERGRTNLSRLASAEAQAIAVTPVCQDCTVRYANAADASSLLLNAALDVPGTLRVRRQIPPRSSRRRYRRSA